jgi:DNA polymerase-3 subunit chi
MTQITFLHGARDRFQAIATWLSSEARPALVYVPTEKHCEQLDRLLWTQPTTGFIPHCRADDKLAAQTPIILASRLDNPQYDGYLVNLSDEIPPNFSRFQQLIEIISDEDGDRLPGRERFRFYRERGYPLETRDISGGIQ